MWKLKRYTRGKKAFKNYSIFSNANIKLKQLSNKKYNCTKKENPLKTFYVKHTHTRTLKKRNYESKIVFLIQIS